VEPDDLYEAGNIVVVGKTGLFSQTFVPDPIDRTYSTSDETVSLLGEEVLVVTATGGTVEAFQGEVQMPLAPLLTSEDLTGLGGVQQLSVPTSADYELTWDRGEASEQIELATLTPRQDAEGKEVSLVCVFDSVPGRAIIEQAVLELLPSGVKFLLFGKKKKIVATAQGNVSLVAAIEMVSLDKKAYLEFVIE
jgi:hypothetical protein